MAKLTVFFRGKAIHSALFENGIVRIGRDETNDLIIDSLAVAPAHAAIIIRDDNCTARQLNDDFPLVVNGLKTKESNLINNDKISLGKHDIVYHLTESVVQAQQLSTPLYKDPLLQNQEFNSDVNSRGANLQIINGDNIGKLLPLKKAMTRLGHNGSGILIISKRKDDYFVSVLESKGTMTLNNKPLDNDILKLNNNDVLVINNISLQFFHN
ncbi:MAG: FHA domain-containing protein [Methylobacter sp.]|nr:FHA domain-containing protein [Methylobacter sp.]